MTKHIMPKVKHKCFIYIPSISSSISISISLYVSGALGSRRLFHSINRIFFVGSGRVPLIAFSFPAIFVLSSFGFTGGLSPCPVFSATL